MINGSRGQVQGIAPLTEPNRGTSLMRNCSQKIVCERFAGVTALRDGEAGKAIAPGMVQEEER